MALVDNVQHLWVYLAWDHEAMPFEYQVIFIWLRPSMVPNVLEVAEHRVLACVNMHFV